MIDRDKAAKFPAAANFAALTPISFLTRTAAVYADLPAVVYGAQQRTWAETSARCLQLASALRGAGLNRKETVSIIADNIPASIEACFGIPMAGGVINAINTRLDAEAIAFILNHAETKIFLVDRRYRTLAAEAIDRAGREMLVIDIGDPTFGEPPSYASQTYEDFLKSGSDETLTPFELDERDPIALNYTSGTTGDPKGVVLHHRGAYLNSIGNALSWQMPHFPVYLWSLPLFHCNGWCFPWTIALQGGVNVCVRGVEAEMLLRLVKEHQVTHLCGAPIVVRMLVDAAAATEESSEKLSVAVMTAGAAPPAALLKKAQEIGFDITHTYGLTEVYGPCAVSAWRPEWNNLPIDQQAEMKARQGVGYPVVEEMVVMNPETMQPAPRDGETLGEVMFRGNLVMSEYFKNPEATNKALAGGYFHSGDLAVCHPDGYLEIRDRSKDIIISGGENISSIEVEGVLYKHPAVSAAAVVAAPHEKWGETPYAFIETGPGKEATEEEIIAFCRERLAHFKCPTRVSFQELPKTSTGKIQKFELRALAQSDAV
ncbi:MULTISPECIES: AMP-binding protein [Hyphococcus]|jgi:fatty-acyl-CoA synthase|uniref:3-methylmercaptopropionyl-CoA ligase n=1 Tax=Hyphococcus luteus TaxID=2058213 RepID=A0A2S7K1D8_9PROT|nr:AMP-binding protein [Marinicaulis flavus]PQA86296.1 acyl-CoA synthetase [Marinicaulis flavus]